MFGRRKSRTEEPAEYWKQRSWVSSAVFLGAAVVIGSVSFLTSGSGGEADAAPPEAVKGPLSTDDTKDGGPAPGKRPKGCDTGKDEEAGRPASAPKDVEWKNLNGVTVPTSPSAGPTRYSGPVWWCYAHTPMGAVMAAHSILTHMSTTDWRTVAEQQLVAGEGRDAFISQRSSLGQSQTTDDDAGVPSGFFVGSFTKNTTQVRLLIKGASGGLGVATVSMRWSGGDWKVEPRSDGALFGTSDSGVNSNGFIKWGAA
ncbi:hypothetical protein [Streptomyces reniochalinae]|uniref:DUF8175 domain-containing protein n=1 Tax=Streptomyces reniochalinae TaxID=2250578 RepID=A0A367EDP7_9ACTN|nr:hypothetical protein [Streptomyces reniochalinae]RCG15765.1 hypothetical protein DQ392_22060 [Streptomyces reniochalinae]